MRDAVIAHTLYTGPLQPRHDRTRDGARCGGRHHRHTWMGLFGRDHPRWNRADMVGHRTRMGEFLLVLRAERRSPREVRSGSKAVHGAFLSDVRFTPDEQTSASASIRSGKCHQLTFGASIKPIGQVNSHLVHRNRLGRMASEANRALTLLECRCKFVDARYGLPNLSERTIPGGTTGSRVRVHDEHDGS
jgi:hypothetical protein